MIIYVQNERMVMVDCGGDDIGGDGGGGSGCGGARPNPEPV